MTRHIHTHARFPERCTKMLCTAVHGSTGKSYRSGTILIVVAAISALLASLTLAFLVQMRSQAEETQDVVHDAQARIMLYAACNYILESGRLGWDRYWGPYPYNATSPSTQAVNGIPIHEEAYGWVDVRDGSIGPKRQDGSLVCTSMDPSTGFGPVFPAICPNNITPPPPGQVARCPMFVWNRTRFSISPTTVYNPIDTVAANGDFGLPLLRNPDPQPDVNNSWSTGSVSATLFNDPQNQTNNDDYLHGNPTPRGSSLGLAWFRVARIGPARFVVTCGAGGTLGYQSWIDVQNDNATAQFGSQEFFNDLLNSEIRMWYMVEWSSAVTAPIYQVMDNEQVPDHYQWRPFNATHELYPWGAQSQPLGRNMAGTFRWIQKLMTQPPIW